MDQDQEDFNTWVASELDLDLLSNDGEPSLSNLAVGPVPISSIPVAESANPNIDSADPLHSLGEVNDYDPFFGASEPPSPTQTASSMQVPQFNLDSDASYTDRYPSESLTQIATANSVPVAQSTGFTGDYMSAFNDIGLDAPYAFLQSLAPTTISGLVQAAQSADIMEDGNSRIIELDPDPVMAASEPASTSSEQLPPPVSTDRVLPIEVAQSAKPQMIFDGSGPSNPSYLTTQPHSFAFPPNEIITAMPTPKDQLRPKSGNSFPSGGYVPIQPKPAAISQITELPSTSEPQDNSLLRSPSQETLVYRPASSVSKGKRKRQRSPQAQQISYNDCLNEFPTEAKEEQHQQPVTKRMKSARTCLRCQFQNKRCSGGFPCERCVSLFEGEAKKRHAKTLQWKRCIDSDILELNFFSETWIWMVVAQGGASWAAETMNFELLEERGTKAANKLMQIVQSSAMKAGLPRVLGFQENGKGIPTGPALICIMELLSSEPLTRHKTCSDCADLTFTLPWMFAVTTLQPDLLAELAGLSTKEIGIFSMYVCNKFYNITAKLLRKAKAEKGSVSQYRAAVIECLDTVYCLITYYGFQDRLMSQFTMAADQTIFQEMELQMKLTRGEALENEDPHRKRIFANLEWQRQSGLRLLKLIRNEGWDHLQDFARHWLRRLGGGHNRYSDVILKNFHLNALCRINHKDRVEDDGQVPPDSDQLCDNIMLEAGTASQSLTKEEFDFCETGFRALSSIEIRIPRQRSPDCHICDLRAVMWVSTVLDGYEEWVMETKARKDSHGPEEDAEIPPDDIPDHMLGLTKPKPNYHNRPMTEFHDTDLFSNYYEDRVWSELAKKHFSEWMKTDRRLDVRQILSDMLSEMSL